MSKVVQRRKSTVKKIVHKAKSIRKKKIILPFWHKTRILTGISILAVLTFVNFGIGIVLQDSREADAAVCRQPNTKVTTRYPISGYYTFTSSNQCVNRTIVESMHKIGGDTVITFGSSLKPVSVKQLRSDSIYKNFKEDGRHGYDIAKAATKGGSIQDVFTYSDKISFSSAAHMCGGRDGVIRNSAGVFNWFLVPVDAGYSACASPSKKYDLIVTNSRSTSDANTLLINEANRYKMKVYLGLPKVYGHNASYSHTFGSFTTRVLKSWEQQYGSKSSFAGVYQTDEVYLGNKMRSSTLKLYKIQHDIVGYQLRSAKRNVLISPYTNMLRSSGNSISSITNSANKVVNTRGGAKLIMAPQDGGGTGRVGVYDTFERNSQVRSVVRSALGVRGTNAQVYIGDTNAFMRAVKKGIGGVELWGNVEAFRPGGAVGNRPATSRADLDKQVRRIAPATSKLIAYRWDYMTKKANNSNVSLYRSLYTSGSKPMLAHLGRINGGIQIIGYKLRRGETVTVTVTSEGRSRKIRVSPDSFRTHLKGRLDVRNIAVPGLKKGKAVYVQVNNGKQLTSTLGFFY